VTWTPPDPYRRSLTWKLANSAWLLTPLLSFGCASVAGFLYVGLRARRPGWWIPGVCYSVVANVCVFAGEGLPVESAASTLLILIWMLTWVTSVGHAVAINASWLRWLAGPPPAAYPPQQWTYPPLPPQVQQAVPDPYQYYAPAEPAPAPAVPLLLDVNAANLEELASLPSIGPERAARAVAARRDRNGFATVAEFAAAAELAPHQFAAVRDRLTCRPAAPAPQPQAQQEPQQDLPYGRIVDI
jgi:hypothetical protein